MEDMSPKKKVFIGLVLIVAFITFLWSNGEEEKRKAKENPQPILSENELATKNCFEEIIANRLYRPYIYVCRDALKEMGLNPDIYIREKWERGDVPSLGPKSGWGICTGLRKNGVTNTFKFHFDGKCHVREMYIYSYEKDSKNGDWKKVYPK